MYYKVRDDLIARMYNGMKQRSKEKTREFHIDREWFFDYVNNSPVFEALMLGWIRSNYSKDFVPSVDRINPLLPYTPQNIQLITWKTNTERNHKHMKEGVYGNTKPVLQLDQNMRKIKEFVSASEAMRQTKIDQSDISKVARGLRASAGGYYWMFKEDYTNKALQGAESVLSFFEGIAHDHLLHFFYGFFIFLVFGLSGVIIVAVLKEIYDYFSPHHEFSWRDIVFTVLPGVVLSTLGISGLV